MKISLIITNFNGLPLLKKNFETVLLNSPEVSEVIFADDHSSDSSVSYITSLQKKYPKIKIIKNKENLGFSKNSNNAVNVASGDLVVLLNNDIRPHSGYIKNTLKHFQDPLVFGVGFSEVGNENWAKIYWQEGYLQHTRGLNITKTHITAWVSGGGSIVRRSLFQKLGGFDHVYEPFYYEDMDLGLRAWKSGYRLLWEPKSIIEHHHESTMSKFPKHFRNYVIERNRLLVTWRNIDNSALLFKNKIAQILRILSGPNYIKIILAAKRQIKKYPPPIFKKELTDIELLALFKNEN